MARPAVLLFAVLLVAAGCGSNNTGKIVGRWKTLASEFENAPKLPGATGLVIYEFTADGRFEMSIAVTGPAPTKAKTIRTGRYALGGGDEVTYSDLNPPSDGKTTGRDKITIVGDNMTVDVPGGKPRVYTRMIEK
jgi:hypothetical protein